MTQKVLPWSLKGVSPEARQAAKSAAKAAGEPVGVWLSGVIRDVAAAETGPAQEQPAAEDTEGMSWPPVPPYQSGQTGE